MYKIILLILISIFLSACEKEIKEPINNRCYAGRDNSGPGSADCDYNKKVTAFYDLKLMVPPYSNPQLCNGNYKMTLAMTGSWDVLVKSTKQLHHKTTFSTNVNYPAGRFMDCTGFEVTAVRLKKIGSGFVEAEDASKPTFQQFNEYQCELKVHPETYDGIRVKVKTRMTAWDPEFTGKPFYKNENLPSLDVNCI